MGVHLGDTQPGRVLFNSDDPRLVKRRIAKFSAVRLESEVEDWEFIAERRALTCGVRLADGRRVVIKVHPTGTADPRRLGAAQEVQRHLVSQGFPAPRPLTGPLRLGQGFAVVEELVDSGAPPDPASRHDRRAMAQALAEITALCLSLPALPELDANHLKILPDGQVWPAPNDPGLNFEPDERTTGWIDRLALTARKRRNEPTAAALVTGHGDWHLEHLRLRDGRPSATYDWDSVVRAPEAFIVGCAVGGFVADWSRDEPPVVPSFSQMAEFVGDYEHARGCPFAEPEREVIHAHWVEMTAYGARVEVARERAGRSATDRYRSSLAEHGAFPVGGKVVYEGCRRGRL